MITPTTITARMTASLCRMGLRYARGVSALGVVGDAPVGVEPAEPRAGRSGLSSAILFSLKVLLNARFRGTQGARQRKFREIKAIKARNVLLVRASHRLLRLHHFHSIGDARCETIARLRQGFL